MEILAQAELNKFIGKKVRNASMKCDEPYPNMPLAGGLDRTLNKSNKRHEAVAQCVSNNLIQILRTLTAIKIDHASRTAKSHRSCGN